MLKPSTVISQAIEAAHASGWRAVAISSGPGVSIALRNTTPDEVADLSWGLDLFWVRLVKQGRPPAQATIEFCVDGDSARVGYASAALRALLREQRSRDGTPHLGDRRVSTCVMQWSHRNKETKMSNTAIVHFRSIANGGYRWIKRSQRRGYWRTLVVKDAEGSINVNAGNVVAVLFKGREGIKGASDKSRYCIDGDRQYAEQVAREFNEAQG